MIIITVKILKIIIMITVIIIILIITTTVLIKSRKNGLDTNIFRFNRIQGRL